MNTRYQVAAAMKAFNTRADEVEQIEPGRADNARTKLVAYLQNATRLLDGSPNIPCPHHPGNPAFNCGACRSEQIGVR